MSARWRRKDRGQALVEFAISSTVLMLILLGLIDFGRVYYFNVTMHGAAREGARHGAWFDPGTNTNPYLDDVDILNSVNHTLSPSSIDATFPDGTTTSSTKCPTPINTTDPDNNPPFPSADYPTVLNRPYLYICYSTAGGAYFGNRPTAPVANETTYEQGDVETILLMSYGLVTGFMQQYLGSNIHVAAYAHFTIQGSHP